MQVVFEQYLNGVHAQQHLYEVSLDQCPCHLHLDLECSLQMAPIEQLDDAVTGLVARVADHLQQRFGVGINTSTDILELCATTSQKWSKHCIIRLHRHCFASNRDVGALVAEVVAAASPLQQHIVDHGIYTANRCFRCPYSCKLGKLNPFLPTSRFAVAGSRASAAQVFMGSLVMCSSSAAAGATVISIARPRLDAAANGALVPAPQARACGSLPAYIGQFLCRFQSRQAGGLECSMRSTCSLHCGLLAVDMQGPGSHACIIASRTHLSNNVYFLVDLAGGTFRVACRDPVCTERLGWLPLPLPTSL